VVDDFEDSQFEFEFADEGLADEGLVTDSQFEEPEAAAIFEADEGSDEIEVIEIPPEFDFGSDAPGSLEATWVVLDEEPGMDYLIKEVDEESLNKMQQETNTFPFQTFKGQEDRIFEARFEIPVGKGGRRYPEGFEETDYA
jgi:hypothetical protein